MSVARVNWNTEMGCLKVQHSETTLSEGPGANKKKSKKIIIKIGSPEG